MAAASPGHRTSSCQAAALREECCRADTTGKSVPYFQKRYVKRVPLKYSPFRKTEIMI
jgi:hypothetical protein